MSHENNSKTQKYTHWSGSRELITLLDPLANSADETLPQTPLGSSRRSPRALADSLSLHPGKKKQKSAPMN